MNKRLYRAQTHKRYYTPHSSKSSDIARLLALWGIFSAEQVFILRGETDKKGQVQS